MTFMIESIENVIEIDPATVSTVTECVGYLKKHESISRR